MSKKAKKKFLSWLIKKDQHEEKKKCMSFGRFVFYEAVIIILAIVLINVYVLSFSVFQRFIHIEDIDWTEVWLVLGASVKSDGQPSKILRERLDTAMIFYEMGKINKILVSWDNGTSHYNEPVAMQKYLISKWVPEKDIYLDYAWFDTYDSLYRARDIFGSSNLTIFTQGFHLHRAIYISKRLWMNVTGVTTDVQNYFAHSRNNVREIFARVKAFFEVEIFKPEPRYLWSPVEIVSDQKIEDLKRDILQ